MTTPQEPLLMDETQPLEVHHFGTDTLPNSSHHPTSLSDHVSAHYTSQAKVGAEARRIAECRGADGPWRTWGPYVSARQWGTVREDYSADGNAWAYFPFEHSGQRAYRWGEDGLGAVCDRYGFLNVGAALWNRRDERLKERLFGLTNNQGNHGEDVKEYFWTLDGTPSHSLMRWLYRYPQAAFPYQRLRDENGRRGRGDREFELADTGVLANDAFFDVQFNYAKSSPTSLLLEITVTNHGTKPESIDVIPQVWLRNTWSWGRDSAKGSITLTSDASGLAQEVRAAADQPGAGFVGPDAAGPGGTSAPVNATQVSSQGAASPAPVNAAQVAIPGATSPAPTPSAPATGRPLAAAQPTARDQVAAPRASATPATPASTPPASTTPAPPLSLVGSLAPQAAPAIASIEHRHLGNYQVAVVSEAPQTVLRDVLFCENETNTVAVYGDLERQSAYPKDAIERRIVRGETTAPNPARTGTKAGFWFQMDDLQAGETRSIRLLLTAGEVNPADLDAAAFTGVFTERQVEADEFYDQVIPSHVTNEDRLIARRAYAGLLWSKQLYRYDVRQWMEGDPAFAAPPPARNRNHQWTNFTLADVISMPDEWEYPWFAAWDLAFHTVTLAHVDAEFAKAQMLLLAREWSMNPNGQLPAYEWEFSDVNPPVHAWSAYQIYLIDGARDKDFLARIFDKMTINFTWWVNRKDSDGSGLFEGGFLGMDNISLFNRSDPLPDGLRLEQSDATSWMGFFALTMLACAVELGQDQAHYDDMATTYLEHFLHIATAARKFGSRGVGIWDESDGFCYDLLVGRHGSEPLRVRSMVGLIPLLAVSVINSGALAKLPDFQKRWEWIKKRRPEVVALSVERFDKSVFLSLLSPRQNLLTLTRMLNENEFLSPHGIRSLSAEYRQPFTVKAGGNDYSIAYVPGESDSPMFGGNSNWRGPVWFPINALLVDALRTMADGLGREGTIEYPTGSGKFVTLFDVADDIEQRLISLFRVGSTGYRPSDGQRIEASPSPLWRDHVTFSEYFNGDSGEGLGATHQTGWTALVAHMISRSRPQP
ncbi:hypothetical protein JT358_02690 [Micrococcales bacterium 31B]|nr:hypothetical protein [Micrococcales bacterium 31B]